MGEWHTMKAVHELPFTSMQFLPGRNWIRARRTSHKSQCVIVDRKKWTLTIAKRSNAPHDNNQQSLLPDERNPLRCEIIILFSFSISVFPLFSSFFHSTRFDKPFIAICMFCMSIRYSRLIIYILIVQPKHSKHFADIEWNVKWLSGCTINRRMISLSKIWNKPRPCSLFTRWWPTAIAMQHFTHKAKPFVTALITCWWALVFRQEYFSSTVFRVTNQHLNGVIVQKWLIVATVWDRESWCSANRKSKSKQNRKKNGYFLVGENSLFSLKTLQGK